MKTERELNERKLELVKRKKLHVDKVCAYYKKEIEFQIAFISNLNRIRYGENAKILNRGRLIPRTALAVLLDFFPTQVGKSQVTYKEWSILVARKLPNNMYTFQYTYSGSYDPGDISPVTNVRMVECLGRRFPHCVKPDIVPVIVSKNRTVLWDSSQDRILDSDGNLLFKAQKYENFENLGYDF